MTLRLFIASPLTFGLKRKIAYLEEEIEKKFNLKIPWIPLKNLHLTLLFLGHLNNEDFLKTEEIFNNFRFPYKIDSLNLKFTKIDYGHPGSQRMIWIYLESSKILIDLNKFFIKELEKRKVNFKKEERKYLPHINLARLKPLPSYPELKKELNWVFLFKKICLFQSILKKRVVEYKDLKTINID